MPVKGRSRVAQITRSRDVGRDARVASHIRASDRTLLSVAVREAAAGGRFDRTLSSSEHAATRGCFVYLAGRDREAVSWRCAESSSRATDGSGGLQLLFSDVATRWMRRCRIFVVEMRCPDVLPRQAASMAGSSARSAARTCRSEATASGEHASRADAARARLREATAPDQYEFLGDIGRAEGGGSGSTSRGTWLMA
jgi:hypothetical protein